MKDATGVWARKHGGNSLAMACRHIVKAMEELVVKPVGFHTAPSDKKRYPDAWCTGCDEALTAAGGEWTPAMVERAGFRSLCPCCHEFARMSTEPGVTVMTIRTR